MPTSCQDIFNQAQLSGKHNPEAMMNGYNYNIDPDFTGPAESFMVCITGTYL